MRIERKEKYIELSGDFTVLSSAPFNGGLREANRIINHTTSVDQQGPIRDYFCEETSLSREELDSVIGFVTAVDVDTAFIGESAFTDGEVKAVISAGVGSPVDSRPHNTINVIVYTDVNLSPSGLANLFIVITEAKVSALRKLDVVKNGEEITGTPTDAIAVAKPNERGEDGINFSGTATDLGKSVYGLVKKGVREALGTNNGYSPGRTILTRLSERGITRDDIADAAFQLLAGGSEDERELEEEFFKILEAYASDPNIHLLVSTGFYLEREKERLELVDDPGRLVTDELIGIDIAEYIGGKNALFNFVRYDRKKPGILGELPPFLDDAVGGLIAGTMTKLFEDNPKA
ncbi:phosphatidylglycerophosphatase A [Candidatus Bipolaricaulota bacterium]|nr:phosphatidylglycerophosphatase A [Candidatus Bipolaricaulota bacterium]